MMSGVVLKFAVPRVFAAMLISKTAHDLDPAIGSKKRL
jgi:hypothetical protein